MNEVNTEHILERCSDGEDSQCSVQVVNNRIKPNIAAEETDFGRWWPEVGRTLVNGVYHEDGAVRKNAVQSMMPIFDRYPHTDVMQLTVTTPELKRLHELFATKIIMEQKRIEKLTDGWINRLDRLCQTCRQEQERVDITKRQLLQKSEEIVKKYNSAALAQRIVAEQLQRTAAQLDREMSLRVQLARMQALTQIDTPFAVDTTSLDNEILKAEREMEASFPPETLEAVRKTYAAHVRNIENAASTRIQERCQCDWIEGLKTKCES